MNDNFVEGTLTCLKPELIETTINTEFPLVLNIEPTNACNSNCYYCPRRKMIRQQGVNFLSYSSYKQIIDQIGKNKLIMLNLHKDGEPLLHKELPKFVSYAKEKDAAQVIHLNTNGILIASKKGLGIIENEIDDITVSVDAVHEETYQKLKGVKGIAQLEKDIISAIEYRNKIDSPTRIRVKIMEFADVDKEEINLFREKWQGVADEVQVTGVHSWSGEINGLEVTDEQSVERYPCALLWYMLAINSNGKVSTCNVDWNYSGVVGHIDEEPITAIWNGKRLKKIRKAQLDGIWNIPPVCQDCVVWVSVGNMKDHLRSRQEFI